MTWFFYLARICNHCTYPACLASCPRGSIYKRPEDGIVLIDQGRCRGYQECVKACPYKKVFYNPMTGTSEKCIACFPKIEQGVAAAVLRELHRQDPLGRLDLDAGEGARGQPDRLPGARAQGRAAAVPAVRPGAERLLHPADARAAAVPAADVRPGRRSGDRDLPQRRPTIRTWRACSACSARRSTSCRAGSARATW